MIYISILCMIVGSFIVLPFIAVDINVRTGGIVRPSSERTEVKAILSGIIDSVYFREGSIIPKDCVIVRLKDDNINSRLQENNYELRQVNAFVNDLQLITRTGKITPALVNRLRTPVYKQQVSRFVHQVADQEASIKKAGNELEMNSFLAAEKVISSKELFDKKIENDKLLAIYHSFKNEQLNVWQQELDKYRIEISQARLRLHEIHAENRLHTIRAPVSGTLQGIQSTYEGNSLRAGETVCSISPETELVAECFISARDAGLVKNGQPVSFRIDAYDHNYFGILTGKVISIDNDFTLLNNNPSFKVRCSFNDSRLTLKNGFTGQLKKGLTLEAMFKVTSRTLFQLLFDKLDDWIDPS